MSSKIVAILFFHKEKMQIPEKERSLACRRDRNKASVAGQVNKRKSWKSKQGLAEIEVSALLQRRELFSTVNTSTANSLASWAIAEPTR